MRWILKFQDFKYDFKYKKGKLNTNADALSRCPIQGVTDKNETAIHDKPHLTERIINEPLDNQVCVVTKNDEPKTSRPRANTTALDEVQPKPRGRPKGRKINPNPHQRPKTYQSRAHLVYRREV